MIKVEAPSGETARGFMRIIKEAGCIFTPVQAPMEVTKDPQAMSNNYFIAVDHLEWGETKVARFPSDLSETPASWRRRAPRFGEHTNEIPSELGYLADEIKTLKKEGIIL